MSIGFVIDFRCKYFPLLPVHLGILDQGKIQHLASWILGEFEYETGDPSYIAGGHEVYVDFIICASSLAYRGWIKDVENIWLGEIDLDKVPSQHLISLFSSVKRTVNIDIEVTGWDLVTILDSLQCQEIRLGCKKLAREETQALVRAMESRVEKVFLYNEIELDMEALSEYSGQGRCRVLECKGVREVTSCSQLITWAYKREWYCLNFTAYLADPYGGFDTDEYDWGDDIEKVEKFRFYLTNV